MLVTYLHGEGRDAIGDPDTAIRTADVTTLDELVRLRAAHLGDPSFRFTEPLDLIVLRAALAYGRAPKRRPGRQPKSVTGGGSEK